MVKCVFLPSEASEFRLGRGRRFAVGRGRRFAVGQKRGGVVEECCFSSCSYENLLLYCSQVRHHNTWSISATNNDRRYVPVIRAYYPTVIWRLLALSSQRNHLRLFLPLHIPFVWTQKTSQQIGQGFDRQKKLPVKDKFVVHYTGFIVKVDLDLKTTIKETFCNEQISAFIGRRNLMYV